MTAKSAKPAKPAIIFYWSTYDDHQQPASVCVFSKGHKIPLRSSQCFCTDARFILPLCLVLNSHTAITCCLFVAAIAHVCC